MIKDPALIIERILGPRDRKEIERNHLVGNMRGAHIADWLAIAVDADMLIDITEPFLRSPGVEDGLAILFKTFPEIDEGRIRQLSEYASVAVAGYVGRSGSRIKFIHEWASALSLATAFVAGQLDATKEQS